MSKKRKQVDGVDSDIEIIYENPKKSKKNAAARFEDNYDTIVRYYFDERHQVKLTDDLKRQLDRWKFVRMVYSSWKVTLKREVASALVKEFKIDEATAYRDITNAQRLYVRLEESNREFERIIRVDEIKQLRAKAIAQGNLLIAAQCDNNLIKIGGYDKELHAAPVVQNIHNELVYDPRLVEGEEIPNLDKIVAQFLVKKKKEFLAIDEADFLEEELTNGKS